MCKAGGMEGILGESREPEKEVGELVNPPTEV